jgi:Putative Ig domain
MGQFQYHFGKSALRFLAVSTVSLTLAACGGGGGGGSSNGSSGTPPTSTNRAPQITGAPATTAQVGAAYAFHPGASDADGDTLSFQISNRPAWASFDPASGSLTGTPASNNIGTNSDIVISVSDGTAGVDLPAFSIQVQAAPQTNLPPVISGTPPTSINAGQAYNFQPSASDPNGTTLTFSISNMPAWATFSTSTGRLYGTPGTANVGTYAGIVIRVSDGTATVALAAFTITVTQVANGTATISWIPPTQNTDGSPLTDLGGYRIYYGTSSTNLAQMVELDNPGLTRYVVQNLSPATWHFAMRSLRTDGTEGEASNTVSKTIL